ncbi:hypothetical protein BOX15_Mlig028661g2, partial [Macrostomum lignano]
GMPIARERIDSLQICKLIQCVRDRNRDQIRKLVASGIPQLVNYGEPQDGETPLIVAAKENDEDMVEFLIKEMGALPDFGDRGGVTPAMRAAEQGFVQALEALAKAGADMKARDSSGKNVLFYCIQPTERHAQCMQVALKHEADVNSAANDGRTAFFVACETADKNPACCRALLAHGANPDVVQRASNRTPLMAACASGSAEVALAALMGGADPNRVDKQSWTAAHYAAKGGHLSCLVALSGYGANFDAYDLRQCNPVHEAAAADRALCIKFLGQRGCNPKPKNADGETPRVIAKDKGFKECLKELRKVEKSYGRAGRNCERWALALYDWTVVRGADLQARLQAEFDTSGSGQVTLEDAAQTMLALGAPWTEDCAKKLGPLYDKAKNGSFDYRDFLLAKKYINKLYLMSAYEPKEKKGKGKKGKGGRKKKAKYPFEICVMPDEQMLRTAEGGPPIMFVPQVSNVTDAERFDRDRPPAHPLQDDSAWYVAAPAHTFVNINDAAKHGDLDSIKLALQKGYSTETRDRLFKTPLMVAAHYGNMEVAKFLLEAGADVNARDNFKWTPLHHACHAGLIDMVELLLKNGANIEAVALNGATPLLRAIETSNLNLVEFLLKQGAKASIETKTGEMIHEVVQIWGSAEVIDFIRTKFPIEAAKDGKGKGSKGGGKGGGKKGAAGGGKKSAKGKGSAKGSEGGARRLADSIVQAPAPAPRIEDEEEAHIRRKARILHDANALDGGYEEAEDVTAHPKGHWLEQPDTGSLLASKSRYRQRFGWESDFPDYRNPFQRNIWNKLEVEGAAED